MKIKYFLKKILFLVGKGMPLILSPFKGQYDMVFIFPSNDLSGATRVHLDIVSLYREKKILVFFTGGISENGLTENFRTVARVFAVKRKKLKSYYLGGITSFINKTKPGYMLGMGTPEFYSVVKSVKSSGIRIIDINHAISSLRYVPDSIIGKLSKRVVIDESTKEYLIKHYEKIGIAPDHICLIYNKTDIPVKISKNYKSKLCIIYVGRGTYEKRVHLLPLIALELKDKIDFEFFLIGDFDNSFKNQASGLCTIIDMVKDKTVLNQYYREADILLLVSSREGFPMVVMEAMAYGTVPVCTPVGGIPYHIRPGFNGFIIEGSDETQIITNAAKIIIELFNNRELLKTASVNAYEYSKEYFNEKRFSDSYNELLRF